MSDDRAQYEKLLSIHKRNLGYLLTQAASYGGEESAPLNIINQISSSRDQIADLEGKLAKLGGGPPPTTPPATPTTQGGIVINNSNNVGLTVHGDAVGGDKVGGDKVLGDKIVSGTQPTQTPPKQQGPQPQQVTLDFQVSDDRVTISWFADVLGQSITPFSPPYDSATLPLVIKALDAMQYPGHPNEGPVFTADEQERLAGVGLWQNHQVPADAYQQVGKAIYAALGPNGQNNLNNVRNTGISTRRTTNYVLRFPLYPTLSVSLAALPWEALTDDKSQPVLLTRGNDVDSCERYILSDRGLPPPLEGRHVPHLLALLPQYQIGDEEREQEQQERRRSWDKLKAAGTITYDEISPATRRALSEYLQDDSHPRPDIIHYFGHGIYQNGKGSLVFDDGRGGYSLVSADRLAAVLGDVRLVVIHACQSAMVDVERGLLTGVAPVLSLVADAVVAMQLTVRTEAATRFAGVLYDELLRRKRSLQEAVAEGRQTLFFEEDDGASWIVPTLYIRGRNQRPIFLVQ